MENKIGAISYRLLSLDNPNLNEARQAVKTETATLSEDKTLSVLKCLCESFKDIDNKIALGKKQKWQGYDVIKEAVSIVYEEFIKKKKKFSCQTPSCEHGNDQEHSF